MNGKKAKQLRKKSKELVIEWLKTMLIDEEKKKLSMDNFEKYLPEQTHVYMNKRIMVSSYPPKWYMKKLKKEYYKKSNTIC